ncbi:ASCH domain-containing protein [Cronobacter sakazakii]
MKALSIRQPWAWLIVNGFKDIENRSWNTKYRGPLLIHASATKPSMDDYSAVIDILLKHRMYHIEFPRWNDFAVRENWQGHRGIERGGIVGIATITDCVDASPSPWFFGPKGFTLTDAKPLPFNPLKGKLSFFETGLTPEDIKGGAA